MGVAGIGAGGSETRKACGLAGDLLHPFRVRPSVEGGIVMDPGLAALRPGLSPAALQAAMAGGQDGRGAVAQQLGSFDGAVLGDWVGPNFGHKVNAAGYGQDCPCYFAGAFAAAPRFE